MTLRAHVLTDIHPAIFTRQAPGGVARWEDVAFTFGLTPDPHADVLIVYTRASWSIRTPLPRERTAFVGAEPPEIHPYKPAFLEQFGLVVVPGERELRTRRLEESPALPWFVGLDFARPEEALGLEALRALDAAERDDRISIVTSRKVSTPMQRARLAFIDFLKERIPDHIVLYGREFNPVADKSEALLPHRYHLALENTDAAWSWTEKLADPLICRALPFYVGCRNVEAELPAEAIERIDISRPEEALARMRAAIEGGAWARRRDAIEEARRRIFERHNAMALFARIARQLAALPASGGPVHLRSERSLPPEPGARGSWPEMLARRAVLAVWPDAELALARRNLRRKSGR